MTKISIIDITLDTNINTLIAEDAIEITGTAKQILDNAIDERKKLLELKQRREQEKQVADDAITQAMSAAYNALVSAGIYGVPADEIMQTVAPHVTTTSAFSLRMKKQLRDNGNLYILERKRAQGIYRYFLTPFNQQP